jgi:dipeptidyl aminopeptidase/acylaminoacyl peptidase
MEESMKDLSKHLVALTLVMLMISACNTRPASSLPATPSLVPTNTPISTLSPDLLIPTVGLTFTPIPTFTPVGGGTGKIAFISIAEGGFDIFVMNADGSNPFRLTKDTTWDCCPDWSPDGTKIAFSSLRDGNREIYVMNADGSGQTNLTKNNERDFDPSWSPDGTKIAFISERDGGAEIYVMNADGSHQTRLTKDGKNDAGPAWSPDGAKIAYESNGQIYLMNVDGTNPIPLTKNSLVNSAPAWSPDSKKIAFAASPGDNLEDIYVMDANGSNPIQLTKNSVPDFQPAWSPDGRKIAFESNREGSSEIYVMNADGSGETKLTNFNTSSGGPAWSPSGQSTVGQPSNCASDWTRLMMGSQAKVSEDTPTPNRVRSGPSTGDTVIARLDPGTVVKVIEGPICADGFVFWKVENASIPGGVGWTAEGDRKVYWLEPFVP